MQEMRAGRANGKRRVNQSVLPRSAQSEATGNGMWDGFANRPSKQDGLQNRPTFRFLSLGLNGLFYECALSLSLSLSFGGGGLFGGGGAGLFGGGAGLFGGIVV